MMEAGAPRKLVYDTAGISVVPLNRASKGERSHCVDDWYGPRPPDLPTESKWPPEVKPTLGDAAHDGAVLLHLARSTGEPVFVWGDDASDFFHQFALASHEYWKVCVLYLPM